MGVSQSWHCWYWDQISLCCWGGRAVLCIGGQHPWPLPTSWQEYLHPCCDNQKYLQILSHVAGRRRTKLAVVEKHCIRHVCVWSLWNEWPVTGLSLKQQFETVGVVTRMLDCWEKRERLWTPLEWGHSQNKQGNKLFHLLFVTPPPPNNMNGFPWNRSILVILRPSI